MVYEPRAGPPTDYRYTSPPPRPLSTSTHPSVYADTPSGIRSISPPHSDHSPDPPSFHSHTEHYSQTPAPGSLPYDYQDSRVDAGGVSQQFDFRLQDQEDEFRDVQLARQYQAQAEADLELHLGTAYLDNYPQPGDDAKVRTGRYAAPPGGRIRGGAGTYQKMEDEEDEDDGKDEFEESFEAEAEWDEKRELGEEEGVGSPAVSFAGGFGAPPLVSASVS
jgi:chitin synthase